MVIQALIFGGLLTSIVLILLVAPVPDPCVGGAIGPLKRLTRLRRARLGQEAVA